jgi:hypothetical protein
MICLSRTYQLQALDSSYASDDKPNTVRLDKKALGNPEISEGWFFGEPP